MNGLGSLLIVAISTLVAFCLNGPAAASTTPDYVRDVAPILTRYCAGCHNEDDREGELSVATFDGLQRGGENGPVFERGESHASRLIQVLTGNSETTMPPEGEPAPTKQEVELLRRWIDSGAAGPQGRIANDPPRVDQAPATPRLSPSSTPKPITAVAYSPDAKLLAVARFRDVELLTADDRRFVQRFADHPGKVNDLRFTQDGRYLIAATGIVGVGGEARIWDLSSGQLHRRVGNHRDGIYAAVASHDGKLLATGGYDREIIIWDLANGDKLQVLRGHNGSVFDLAFSPNGQILASASADSTVKVWSVTSGQRLDTLSQPLKEQHSVDISPDGQFIVAGGEDNRIRLWSLVSIDKPRINPLLMARFAHEQAIERVRFTSDGSRIVSLAADRKLKTWDALRLTQLRATDVGQDVAQALSIDPSGTWAAVGGMDGALVVATIVRPTDSAKPLTTSSELAVNSSDGDETAVDVDEQEPNDPAPEAQRIQTPARVTGTIYREGSQQDVDSFRFRAGRGQELIIEIKAARDKSPLDSRISVLSADGQPVPRVLLKAVRDSYFTFRGKDSNQTGDFRLHNWREMRLNQLVYASGEVVKLYHYPRGPDSGFNVYPNFGSRHTFFDTTSVTHALHEPCYVVEAHPPGTELPPNGLPSFLLNYENDDESQRRYGRDSYLSFQAPQDGEYIVRVEDVRGLQGPDFKYELTVRAPRPDFRVSISGQNPSVPRGAGRKFELKLERLDGFDGEVAFEVEQLPAGFEVAGPMVVQAGQLRAWGAVTAAADALAPAGELAKSKLVATATIDGQEIRRDVGTLGEITLADPPKLMVHFSKEGTVDSSAMPVIEMQAGSTTTALIRIDRQGHEGRVAFGSEEAVLNAPHGVYVDNIGLNGVLITESQNERLIYITAEPWVDSSERVVFVEAGDGGTPTSNPVLLRIVNPRGPLSRVAGAAAE